MKSYVRKSFKLPELFDMYMGKTPDRNNPEYWENGTHPWISIADMTSNGKLVTHTKECITDKAIRETGIKPINYNTVIMSFKLSVGKVSKVATVSTPAYSNEAIMAFEIPPVPVGSPMILNDYAYYLLQSLDFTNTGNKAVMGKTLNKAILQNTIVNVHIDLKVQSEIVSVLDKITALIDKRRKQLETLDELVKARFVELFGDPVVNPHNYPKVSLSELAEIKIGPFGSLLHKDDYIENGHALVNPSHIIDGRVSVDNKLTISDEKYDELSAYHLLVGDVVMGRRGEMGRCAVVSESGLLCGTGSLLIRTKGNVTADYLQKIISFPTFKKTIEDMAVGQTMPNLNVPIVSNFQIIKPPMEVQKSYYDFVEQMDKLKLEVQKALSELETLKKSLMQKYFG